MKKKNVLNLIKYYSEKDDKNFKNEAYIIAKDFDINGDYQLAEYIMSLLSESNTFVPQINEYKSSFFNKVNVDNSGRCLLPDAIYNDILGLINAVGHRMGVNKFLFTGKPGTGKTETVKQVARILKRDLFVVDFATVIDSKLGQTQKNITDLFKELNSFNNPGSIIVLFDEIDGLALDRTSSNDLREMGRSTSTLLKQLDDMNDDIVLIATTNLDKYLDKAILRRFDSIINFDRYEVDDLVDIAYSVFEEYIGKCDGLGRNERLFKKIVKKMSPILSPGELKNAVKTSMAFSNPNSKFDYLNRMYSTLCGNKPMDIVSLNEEGFTVREIETFTGISKSTVSRELKEESNDE